MSLFKFKKNRKNKVIRCLFLLYVIGFSKIHVSPTNSLQKINSIQKCYIGQEN